jgi:hypothetical protein
VSIEFAFSFAVVFLPPVANELGHRGPSALGWLIALAAPFVVVAVDAVDKTRHGRLSP